MARKIVILDRVNLPSDQDFRVAFRLDVPPSRRVFYANPAATSVVIGAPQEEIDDIRAGAVVEEVHVVPARAGVGKAALYGEQTKRHAARQAEFQALNPWARYGTSWDGSAWTEVSVA